MGPRRLSHRPLHRRIGICGEKADVFSKESLWGFPLKIIGSNRYTCKALFLHRLQDTPLHGAIQQEPDGQNMGLLVQLGSTLHSAYTCCLSTSSSRRVLIRRLILRLVSRLYAFSVYPCRTSLPGSALGRTAGSQEVRDSRSSRTKESSSQPSARTVDRRPNCLTTF